MSKYVLFNGRKIHYSVQGSGKTIVLLHGFMGSLDAWKYFIRKLSREFSVVTVDLPGHGRSDVIQKVHSMELMAEAVNAVFKELNIGSCLMVGHSMGGYVALAFAAKYPKKVRGLSLFHSQAAADTPEAQANRDRTIRLVSQDKKGFIQNFIPGLFDTRNVGQYAKEISHLKAVANSMPKEAITAALEGMKVRPDRTHILAQVRVPVQFIIGKNDPRIPLELVIPQTLLPSHSEVVILDEVGHMGFIESRQETFEAVRHFALKVLQ